jgi:hypothetical protein
MKQATIRSVCECQSKLEAILDEHRYVLTGFVVGPDREREIAPAHSIDAEKKRFGVGWLCNFCGRNTMRRFDAEALVWRDVEPPTLRQAVAVPPAPRVPDGAPPPPAPVAAPPAPASAAPSAPAAPSTSASASPSSPPANAATAVALKSLTSPSKPPSVPPRAPSTPPEPTKAS